MFTGALVNFIAIIAGGMLGTLLKKGFSKELQETLMKAMALCVLFIGITGVLKGQSSLLIIISMAVGCIIGETFKLEQRFNTFANKLERRFTKNPDKSTFAQGFVTSSLLFCVGAMAIVGSFESGINGNHSTLFAKSLIDGIVSISFAASLGAGVLFSSALVLAYEGLITFAAGLLQPLLTGDVIADMTAIGSLLIIAMALNMLKLTEIKILNLLPAVLVPVIYGLILMLL
jgi:uncharacterized membrane protein YqgA involved in biofilm formation